MKFIRFIAAILASVLTISNSNASAAELLIGSTKVMRGDRQQDVVNALMREFNVTYNTFRPGPESDHVIIVSRDGKNRIGELLFHKGSLDIASIRAATCSGPDKDRCVLNRFFELVFKYSNAAAGIDSKFIDAKSGTSYAVIMLSRNISQKLANGLTITASWPVAEYPDGEAYISVGITN